jgi:hypothetical protein
VSKPITPRRVLLRSAPDGGMALCVERNEELMVAESYASLERAIERSQELRAALGAIGLPDDGND